MYHTTISIDVPDLAGAVRFYTEALGLKIKKEPTKSMAILQTMNLDVYLLQKADGTQAYSKSGAQRTYSRHWTPVHLDFVVDDVAAAVARALAAGAIQEAPVENAAWGRLALMADPFGHGFCLVEFRNRGYDEIADPPATSHAGSNQRSASPS